jgi:hypothetical protein
MRNKRWLFILVIMIFLMACSCGLLPSLQGMQNAATTAMPALQTYASTDLPAMETAAATVMPALLTGVPTAEGMLATLQAQQSASGTCPNTPTPGGLGVSINTAKTILQMSQQFAIADGSADGQPATIITLTANGASSFPAIAQGFTAQFIGDPCNLSKVTVTIPRTDQQDSADQGTSVLNIVLTGTLPADVQLSFLTWVSQYYATVAVGGQQQTTIKTFQFTLQRNQTSMVLNILPVK